MTQGSYPITVAYGDGIGPEITEAVLEVLKYAKARITIQTVEVGKVLYERGYNTGIGPDMWESLKNTKILLKGPITTPQGGGYKSLNVTLRKSLSLYANVRPCIAYPPFVKTFHPAMNLVIVRENEEDLYTGIEYRQTRDMCHAIKMISRSGCERIIRYAFEYAVNNNRRKVTCLSKDNIMKMTDGLFHKVFDEIAESYPQIEKDHYIIDIGAARLANTPENFDVVVTSNLYGDIISDIVAETSGSVGLAGSANIGAEYAMFEAIHGSAPLIADQNRANPSGLLHASIMMLVHLGQGDIASKIHNAWLKTLEDGIHTADIYREEYSNKKVGTKEFAQEIIARLGEKPTKMQAVEYKDSLKNTMHQNLVDQTVESKQLVGVDIYFDWSKDGIELAEKLNSIADGELRLQVLSCRGLKIWPVEENSFNRGGGDHWNARFVLNNQEKKTTHEHIIYLLNKLNAQGFDFIKTENLYSFDDKVGFSLSAGA
ncbi:Isocitrate dehydrogenase [NADP] [Rickettsiales bacterium Ac37b]|nr:Isocitrate dehydrogenase [NADP] [Rickettsiales bacterium Ac37b]